MPVQAVTSGRVQSNWAEVADMAKMSGPVTITQYGRPTLVLMAHGEAMEALRELAKRRLRTQLAEQASNPSLATADLSLEELNKMIDETYAK